MPCLLMIRGGVLVEKRDPAYATDSSAFYDLWVGDAPSLNSKKL